MSLIRSAIYCYAFLIGGSICLSSMSNMAKAAENQEEDKSGEIVVIGNKTIKEAVGDFIDTTMAKPRGGRNIGQYARFSSPICPKVFGFSDANNVSIEKRIRSVSSAAEIKVGKVDCKPNVYIVVIEDGNSAISMLRKEHHKIFGSLSIPKRKQLAVSAGPVFGWKAISTSAENGTSMHVKDDALALVGYADRGVFADPFAAQRPSYNGSRIKLPTKEHMRASYLLLEKKALVGLTTVQIADYSAMQSLMDISANQDEISNFDSILSLFKDRESGLNLADMISEWDLALLSALYSTPSDIRANMQRSAMQQKIAKELDSAPP